MKKEDNRKITKKDKLKALKLTEDLLNDSDRLLDQLYDEYYVKKNKDNNNNNNDNNNKNNNNKQDDDQKDNNNKNNGKKDDDQKDNNNKSNGKKDDNRQIIDKNNSKYKLTLEFLSALMVEMGKDPIHNIVDFKDVKRDDLLSQGCNDIMEQYLDRFISEFGKVKIDYRRKKLIEQYIVTLIKRVSRDLHFKFNSYQRQNFVRDKKTGQYNCIFWRCYSIS